MESWLATWVFLLLATSSIGLNTDRCEDALGMESNNIPDKHVTASSYFDEAVNAFNGRAHVERGGGAWCPRAMIDNLGKEHLEVNLGSLHILTKVEVQGRFGNGQGKEYAEKYKLQYWREGLGHWITYRNGRGEELLEGNSNTYLAKSSQLSPPVIVSRVRFVPYSDHLRTICMRVEVYGCPYTDGLLSYSMMDGDLRGRDKGLRDVTYDGQRDKTWLSGGLGQLTDGENGHTNFKVDSLGNGPGYEWVGWKNDSRGTNPVELSFKFDAVRNFSALEIYTNNFFTRDTMMFSRARILFSVGGEFYTSSAPVQHDPKPDRIFEQARSISIPLHGATGRYVRVQLYFALQWIMISEVTFKSVLCECNATDDDSPVLATIATNPLEEKEAAFVPVSSSSSSSSSGLLLGGLVTLGVVFGVIPVVLGVYYYRNHLSKGKSKTPSLASNGVDSRKVSMKMKDLHINMNLSPTSNGYSRAKGKLYGHVHMEEEVAAMYQEPYKGPIHNPGYYTLNRATTPGSEAPLKAMPDTEDDSVDYAVPDVNMTPPPPFSEVYTPPPPVPLTRPPNSLPARIIRETPPPPPVPAIPPPPEQQYYAAPRLCQPSNIQGVTGTVTYSPLEGALLQGEVLPPEVPRHRIRVLENLGEGLFGQVQLCEVDGLGGGPGGSPPRLVALKSLKATAGEMAKEDFRAEVGVLSHLEDAHIVRLLGVVSRHEPLAMMLEYMEYGDLYQFLRRHVSEGVAVRLPLVGGGGSTPPVLSYGALIYMGTQIASGMKYLEDLNFVHRDLASRNCLVGRGLTLKISDFGMSRPLYSSDYYRVEGRALLPIRWMAWESVLQGRFTTKSDVWAFGVTLWEILTMARRQPYDELSDEGVLENVSHCYHGDGSGMIDLPQPPLCPREMYDMLTACWRPNDRQRPPFWEIHMFLQRKNLGYTLDYED